MIAVIISAISSVQVYSQRPGTGSLGAISFDLHVSMKCVFRRILETLASLIISFARVSFRLGAMYLIILRLWTFFAYFVMTEVY